MTLILTVNGPESIWMLADRRLSFDRQPPKDDGRKVMFLETTDGVAILGYAGLGMTAQRTEPADWMSAVLRSRSLPLEQALAVLAEAMKRQLPRHLVQMSGEWAPAHNVLVPAFLGDEARLYTIDLAFAGDRRSYRFRYTRHVVDRPPGHRPRTPRLGLGGSGALYLARDRRWVRGLLRLVRGNDRRKLPPQAVADYLASLNHQVHLGMEDGSVGPRCIVAWRHRKGGVHKGGGGHQFYTGAARDSNSPSLPTIANGMDVSALTTLLMPHFTRMFDGMRTGEPRELDVSGLDADLTRLPDAPDETLR